MSVCMSVFPHDISKTDAAMITKIDVEMFTMSPENLFILESKKVNGQGTSGQKHCRRGSLHSYECWLLLGCIYVYSDKRNSVGRSNECPGLLFLCHMTTQPNIRLWSGVL